MNELNEEEKWVILQKGTERPFSGKYTDHFAENGFYACKQCDLDIPVVVRLVGNNAELGAKKLNESGLNLIGKDDLLEASKCIVQKVEELA